MDSYVVRKTECIFCGKSALVYEELDKIKHANLIKHPDRIKRVDICRGSSETSMKDQIISVCMKRNCESSNEVLIRISEAPSDMTAMDFRYHKNCKVAFMAPKAVQQATKDSKSVIPDSNLIDVFNHMTENPDSCWTTTELCSINHKKHSSKSISH